MSKSFTSKLRLAIIIGLAALAPSLASSRHAGAAQKGARVTEVVLKADDARPEGPCPINVRFGGYITADGPATVTYTFTRSDGATGPVFSLDFKGAGTQAVSTAWTLGDASALPSYEGWMAVRVLSPNELESSHQTGSFALRCGAAGAPGFGEGAGRGSEGAPGAAAPKAGGGLPQWKAPAPRPSPSGPSAGGAGQAQTTLPGGPYDRVPPVTNRPAGGYGNSVDGNGEARTSEPAGGPRPLAGSFRVTLNGYRVNRQTRDDALERDGVGDEVTLVLDTATIDSSGGFAPIRWGNIFSSFMGQQPRNEIRAGTGSDRGGLVTGDGFPTSTPWRRLTPVNPGIPPNVLFEGDLTQGANAALIVPTVWESDGTGGLRAAFADAVERDRPAVTRSVVRMIGSRLPYSVNSFLLPGSALGIGNTVTLGHGPLGLGQVDDRPVGMRVLGDDYGFTPQALVLTYDGARALARADLGLGRGVIPVRYEDDRSLEGDYTLFIQVEETSGAAAAPCAGSLASTFTGTATMTTTHPSASGPFTQSMRLAVSFEDCRARVRITEFPPVSVTFDTPVGANTTTVTMPSGGAGVLDPDTGRMDVPVTLRFGNSIVAGGTSFVDMTLSTAPAGGSPLRAGAVTLAGSGRFRGGFLNGQTCTLTVSGTLTPVP